MKAYLSPQNSTNSMFTFSSTLWYNKQSVNKTTGMTSVYLQVYIGVNGNSETDEFRLMLRWPAELFNQETSSLLPRSNEDPDVNDYNMIIMTERARHNEIAKLYRLSGKVLTMETFKREIRINDTKTNVIAYMDVKRTELVRKKEIEFGTWKNVGSTIFTLKRYAPEAKFTDINARWMSSFKSWLAKEGRKPGEGLKPGTVWTKIKDLKHYLNLANEEATISVDEGAIHYPNSCPVSPVVYLNRDELRRMMLLYDEQALSGTQMNVLKAYLFQSFTSLRISDVYRAGNNWMINGNMLEFVMFKGSRKKPKVVKVPLVPMARKYIDDSLKTFFTLPSQIEYNRTLKDLAAKAEIKKKVSSHTARHTYGYLFMTTIGNIYALSKVMGHSSIKTTQKYAHLDEEYMMEQTLKIQQGFEDMSNRGVFRSVGME